MKVPYYRIPSKANLMMAAYLSKKTMAPIIGERSPLHVIFGRFTLFQRDDYSNRWLVGCTCFVKIPSPAQDKLSPTSHSMCFLEWGWGTPLSKGLQVLMILLHDDSTFLDMSPFSNLLRSSGLWDSLWWWAIMFPCLPLEGRGGTIEEFMWDSIRILRFNRVSKIRVTRVISLRGSFAGLWRQILVTQFSELSQLIQWSPSLPILRTKTLLQT